MGMSKKAEEEAKVENPQPETQEQPQGDFLTTLKEKGTAIITAKTREELATMVDQIPSDIHYGAGAVNHDYDQNIYTLTVFTTLKE